MKKLLSIILICLTAISYAQDGVGINTNTPDGSSVLDIVSTSKGILIPRMTIVQRDAIISPANGLLVYQTDGVIGFYFYDGILWSTLEGVQGPAGDTGVNGLDGANGIDGATGPAGLDGSNGVDGANGIDGIDGATGPTGLDGSNGADGANGIDGAVGPQGPTGSQGPAGVGSSNPVITKNTDYTIQTTDGTVISNATTDITFIFPSASAAGDGKILYLYAITNTFTIVASGSDIIYDSDGAGTTKTGVYSGIFISDGSNNWYQPN
ncbi:collagen-like protein [Psychroserpens burtonensis]|uniref:collagen-like protein n=1 Tax=Psychroserpens burtonensis TaxID=49278 RepID=UPI0003F8D150|nr:collagen-like protein [Psychroserpens burtonensis]